ncbi:MAG: hypothetical protein PHT07_23580 [Paludibacter sp.]|nr:hypothetical protein [Paludibacter sp.]
MMTDNDSIKSDLIVLTEDQIAMLQLSELDIQNSNLITQKELDKIDFKWLQVK